MPSELMKALRAKYKDPREAMKVLGLDEKLLEGPKAEDEEEDDDKEAKDKGGRDKAKDAAADAKAGSSSARGGQDIRPARVPEVQVVRGRHGGLRRHVQDWS